MSEKANLRIIIIDDNTTIHSDFIKILTVEESERAELNELEKDIFAKVSHITSNLPHFSIDVATQGQEGVEKIRLAQESGSPFALAFVDIRMPPGWDGIETIKHIWEIAPDMQIVICSAYSDYSWEQTVEELGQRENLLVLKKPFDTVSVRQLACALTKKWQLLQDSRDYTHSLERRVSERTALLNESLSITRGTLESSTDGMMVVSANNTIIDFNQRVLEIWKTPQASIDENNAASFFALLASKVEQGAEFLGLIEDLKKDPEMIATKLLTTAENHFIELYTQPYKSKEHVGGRVWSFRDVTQRVLAEYQLQHLATHDSLTGLPNRVMLMEQLDKAIQKAHAENHYVAVYFFDIDSFKLVNDSWSHAAGDELLQSISKRLWHAKRQEDILTRLGGDEFVLVATGVQKNETVKEIANRLIDTFKKVHTLSNGSISVTPSVGVSIYPQHGKTHDELLQHADMAMYKAKELGGNQYQLYNDEIDAENNRRAQIEHDLSIAIENKEFFLNFQPEVDIVTGNLKSIEALLRWQHPTLGLILPVELMPIAEKMRITNILTEWMLRTACKQNKAWQDAGFEAVRMTVNITMGFFNQANLANIISDILAESKLSPEYLELALTENVLIKSLPNLSVINSLKNLGINIALYDYGSGYSTLNYLRQIHIDTLKLDRTLLDNLRENKSNEVIFQAILSMAESLKLEVVSECHDSLVDSAKKAALRANCDRPLSTNEVESMFAKA